MNGLFQNLKGFLARYSLNQKLGMAVAAALVVALTWGMVFYVNSVDLQVLYSDLDPQEAQSIVTKLQTMTAPYELSQDGRSIRVGSDRISEIRLQLASQGLPESGRIGFEIFDRTNFGLTNFQEQVNYQRALEGELARSIMTLDEVGSARVHLVLSKDSLYQESDNQTKASVILKLKNGRTLPESAVQGIVHLVSNSVKDLSPEKVTVIDFRGKVLSQSESENSLTGQQLDTRQKMESELTTKIVEILEPAVGMGKVRPQVSVAMDFQQVEETVEQYDPQNSVVRSEQRQQENAPPGSGVGGIVGVRTVQQTPASLAPGQTATNNFLKQNETINYEVSKAVRHIVNPIGKLEKLSVAVLIDNQTQTTTAEDGTTKTTSIPRKPEELKKYRDLVSAAIAFSPDRGDQLIVENVSFENEIETIAEPTLIEKNAPMILQALRYLIIPIVFFLVYLLFIRPVQKSVFSATWQTAPAVSGRRQRAALPQAAGGGQQPMTVKQLEARLRSGEQIDPSFVDDFANTPERELLPLPAPSRMDLIRKRVVEHAKDDPETVARLVRVWLNDEKKNK